MQARMEPTRVELLTGLHCMGRLLALQQRELTDSEKHSSLLWYGKNYDHKSFYDTGRNIISCQSVGQIS
jgi:hypothetical protein